jgi:hypothetical protein
MDLETSYYKDAFLVRRTDVAHHPWILGVQGAPYEMGFQQGVLLADEIRGNAGGFLTPIFAQFGGWTPDGKTPPTSQQIAAGREVLLHMYTAYFEQPVREIAPELCEEIIGLSEGLAKAGTRITLEDLLLGNCVPEITEPCFFSDQTDGNETADQKFSQCSDMVAWGEATVDGRLIHAANYDYNTFGVLHKYMGIVVARPDEGHPFIAQCIPGRVGYYRGLNDAEVIATEKTSQSVDRNMREQPRIPHSMHMRKLIQNASNINDAVNIMSQLMGTTGNNNLISDAKVPAALEIQGSCNKMAVFGPPEGMDAYWNTNQYFAYPGYNGFVGENLARDQLEYFEIPFEQADTPEKWIEALKRDGETRTFSWQRFEKLGELIRQHYGSIDVRTTIDIMSAPPVSRETDEKQILAPECEQLFGIVGPIEDYRLASIFSVVFDAADMTAHVAVGAEPAQAGNYWPISFPRFNEVLGTIRDEKLTADSDADRKTALLAGAF